MKGTITDSELYIMQILWKHGKLSAKEIIQKIPANKEWSEKTIRTFISRLVEKDAIIKIEEQGGNLYKANLTKKAYYKQAKQQFLEKLYHGSFTKMITNLIEDEKLSEEEVKEIQDLLNEKLK